ncbi:DUF2130 domain-containing protein [Pontibacter chinhatensis]|uniref:DUF2130 domain-containing protein n=1 Tax=Pontibacter chinhatensis TaxID=1436961 RepID=A0A1I2QPA5_9BACT|nr:DUF2130 domain-containing protein [Pontibacter chinhatensis]SFG29483.1 hypothetical protein SAMN05421739_10254 [Pontibacter chinhatensis]
MKNATTISCPQCSHEFNPEAAIASRIEQELKNKFAEQASLLHRQHEAKRLEVEKEKKQLEEMRLQQEQLVQEQVARERGVLENKLRTELNQSMGNDLALLKEEKALMEQKLKEKQQNELQLLRRQRELEDKERELELKTERRILSMRTELEQKIRQTESEQTELKLKEKDKQIEDMKKLVEEMKRKSEQGSMQLQGEVQELALEEKLQQTFPFDLIAEVGKGVRGADALQTVRGTMGEDCGTIIYESKRTKAFGNDWVEKLKADARTAKADIMVLVTEVLPKGMQHFGQYEGVWVCTYQEFVPMVVLLRDCLLKVAAATASQENKGSKMQMLYNYLTSTEFSHQFAAVAEGISSLKSGIVKERAQMEKIWKEREKQLEKSLLNICGMYGSVRGIAGGAVQEINLLEQSETQALPPVSQPQLN